MSESAYRDRKQKGMTSAEGAVYFKQGEADTAGVMVSAEGEEDTQGL